MAPIPAPSPHMGQRLWAGETHPLKHDDTEMPRISDSDGKSGEPFKERTPNDLSVHLMSVSAGMVGVCLTVIGLFRIITNLQKMNTVVDHLVAVDSLFFLAVCIIAYCAMRILDRNHRQRLERIADALFLVALSFMAVICALIVWAIA